MTNMQNQLITEADAQEAMRAQSMLSQRPMKFLPAKPISQLIDDEENRTEIMEECRIVLAANTPASANQVNKIVFQILNHYEGFDRRSPESKAAIIADWLESLSRFPIDVLALAARQWRECEKSAFTPTIGQILALCETASYRMALSDRAHKVLEGLK